MYTQSARADYYELYLLPRWLWRHGSQRSRERARGLRGHDIVDAASRVHSNHTTTRARSEYDTCLSEVRAMIGSRLKAHDISQVESSNVQHTETITSTSSASLK